MLTKFYLEIKGDCKILKNFSITLNWSSIDIEDIWIQDMHNFLKDFTYYVITNIIKDYKKFNYLINKNLELSLIITNDDNIKEINSKWRKVFTPTNVLSMAIFDEEDAKLSSVILLGDIIISIDTAKREADVLNISLQEHIIKLFLHGILHIFGFDHNNDKQAKIMEKLENKFLQSLKSKVEALTSNYWK